MVGCFDNVDSDLTRGILALVRVRMKLMSDGRKIDCSYAGLAFWSLVVISWAEGSARATGCILEIYYASMATHFVCK